jgi:long-subunit acyl-CoA synthetase (AMP-forming)
VALDWPGGHLSYSGLLTTVASAKARLRASGFRVLALDLDNGPAWVILDIAALDLGITLIPLP